MLVRRVNWFCGIVLWEVSLDFLGFPYVSLCGVVSLHHAFGCSLYFGVGFCYFSLQCFCFDCVCYDCG